MTIDTTCACGRQLPPDVPWCPRCFARRPSDLAVGAGHRAFGAGPSASLDAASVALPPGRPVGPGRFAKTDVSFGLTGRIICTVLLLLPLAVFVYLATELIGIGGIVVYGGIICPWALRDLWKHPGRN